MRSLMKQRVCELFMLLACVSLLSSCHVDSMSMRVPPLPSQQHSQVASSTPHPQDVALQQARTTVQKEVAQFRGLIQTMQQAGVDISSYQQQYSTDQTMLRNAKLVADFKSITQQLQSQMVPSNVPLAKALAKYPVQEFHQEAMDWGKSHQYHNSYDGKSYPYDFEYYAQPDNYGAGSVVDNDLQAAENADTLDQYQSVINEANDDMTLLHAMEENAQESQSVVWNQPHTSDQDVMQHYHATSGLTIVVSNYDQALRLYKDGKLIQAYQVVTGQFYRPTILGEYQINSQLASTWFTTFEAPDSAFYFPPTLVHWVLGFGPQNLGYFIHASPWRDDNHYGQNKEFPHDDSHTENTESRDGSHGCVNLPIPEAETLFNEISMGTNIIVY